MRTCCDWLWGTVLPTRRFLLKGRSHLSRGRRGSCLWLVVNAVSSLMDQHLNQNRLESHPREMLLLDHLKGTSEFPVHPKKSKMIVP